MDYVDVPIKRVGSLAPRGAVTYTPYHFYQLAPKGVILMIIPLGIQTFSKDDVDRVFGPLDSQLEQMKLYRPDLVEQSGVPLLLLSGLDGHDRRIDYIHSKMGVPVTSSLLGAVAAARHMGVRTIAFANRFNVAMNETLKAFFVRAGIAVAGYESLAENKDVMDAARGPRMTEAENNADGMMLARRAFERFPKADAIYMGGGSWSLHPVIEKLEPEFRRPILGHHQCMVWDTLTHLGLRKPIPGMGMLLESA